MRFRVQDFVPKFWDKNLHNNTSHMKNIWVLKANRNSRLFSFNFVHDPTQEIKDDAFL